MIRLFTFISNIACRQQRLWGQCSMAVDCRRGYCPGIEFGPTLPDSHLVCGVGINGRSFKDDLGRYVFFGPCNGTG